MNTELINIEQIKLAQSKLKGLIRETPLEYSHFYSKALGGKVWLKLENLQLTGSFKIRGVINRIFNLSKEVKERGVVTASSGNHGQAVGYVAKMLGIKATIFVPKTTPRIKIEGIAQYNVDLRISGDYEDESVAKAHEFEKSSGMVYIHPYNDVDVIAAQGTIGLEILEKIPNIDVIVVPVGGGGLIAGIAIAAKSISPRIKLIGVQSIASPVMYESLKAGGIIKMSPPKETITEGICCGVEEGSITFDLVKRYVGDILLVSEREIKEAIKLFLEYHHQIAEGSGAAGLAALMKYKNHFKNCNVAVVISGGNINIESLKRIL
jgi:threonine dehydratase